MSISSLCLVTALALQFCISYGDQDKTHQNTNDVLDERLKTLENTVIEQDKLMKKMFQVIQEQQEEIKTLKQAVNRHGDEFNKDTIVMANEALEQTFYSGQSMHKRLLFDPEKPLAFHARIDQGSIDHIALNDKIVFDITALDMGGAYNNVTGIFTAPADGLYFFSLSVAIIHTSKSIHAEIMKNGANVAGTYANGMDQGSISVVLQLKTGDNVWVSPIRHDDTYLWGDTLTSFTGFMISPIY